MPNEPMPPDLTATAHVQASGATRAVGGAAGSGFAPGTILAHRYRVVSLIGRGGMGEVYRADDLMVGETVALKFLPEALARDESLISRFRNEVRTARMVSHPNVCRVHDLAEADGRSLLTMQFIDGEDLASLLRRIGRLPEDKALEIARKLCDGLQAAHDKGVIHRDLKPANIMIDGRGEALITDFGLAAVASEIDDVSSGTPAYMAPEQRSGETVTERSDIYSLGLVLHEIFTGRRRDKGTSSATPLNPDIARVIDQCCDADPKRRWASARAVARALPGGDPLAGAIAAGRTPSPEMVASAGERTGLTPGWGLGLLGITVAAALFVGWMEDRINPVRPLPPEEMRIEARNLVRQTESREVGYEASGIQFDGGAAAKGRRQALWLPHQFWYRTSQHPLGSVRSSSTTMIGPTDPPLDAPGMVLVVMDMQGKLIRYEAVRDVRQTTSQSTTGTAEKPAWGEWIKKAGLAPERLKAVEEGPEFGSWNYRDEAGARYKVDAVVERGRIRQFRVRGEWEQEGPGSPWPWRLETILVIAAVTLAIRNYRLGRADMRSTLIIGVFVASTTGMSLLLRATDLLNWSRQVTPVDGLGLAILLGMMFGSAYCAMEPFLRRKWPVVLVTWTRLMYGDWRNPTVGRDVLIGMATASATLILGGVLELRYLPGDFRSIRNLQSTPFFAAGLIDSLSQGLTRGVMIVFVLFLVRLLVRKDWIAAIVVVVLFAAMLTGQIGVFHPVPIALFVTIGAVQVWVAMRFGLLAKVAAEIVVIAAQSMRTLDSSQWTAMYSYLAILWVSGIAFIAFRIATAGKPILTEDAAG